VTACAFFATKGGASAHPDWYRNLIANPDITIEIGKEQDLPVHVVELEGDERDVVWERHKRDWPQFAEYGSRTDRTIPALELRRR